MLLYVMLIAAEVQTVITIPKDFDFESLLGNICFAEVFCVAEGFLYLCTRTTIYNMHEVLQ